MVPTLIGRWQTRFLLLLTVGLFWTLPFMLIAGLIGGSPWVPLVNLGLILVLGFGWDILYIFLQSFRWDRDWPPAFQWLAAIWEGLVVYLINVVFNFGTPWWFFLLHYGLVWVMVFLTSQSAMRVVFPRWRFRGGTWIG